MTATPALAASRTRILPARRTGTIWFGVMVTVLAFVAGIGLATLLGLWRDGAAWNGSVRGRLTVQIMPEGLEPPPQEIPAAMAILKSYPGIVSATLMSKSENDALVAPWLGDGAAAANLPFPALIDVKLAPGAVPDISDLQKRLRVSAPHAVINDHRQLANPLAVTSPALLMPALLLAGSAGALLFVVLAFIRGRISTQWQHLELFHLLGASDWRIAKLFAATPVLAVAVASATGTALAGALSALWAPLVAGPASSIPVVSPADLLWLAFIPATTAIIALATAYLLVLSALRRG